MRIQNTIDARKFAAEWAAAWNVQDVETILDHFAEEVVFSSPLALKVTGVPTTSGKSNLRTYWQQALSRVQRLHFEIQEVLWDSDSRYLAIIYGRSINGQRDRAIELLHFAETGLVDRGDVFYGVEPLMDSSR